MATRCCSKAKMLGVAVGGLAVAAMMYSYFAFWLDGLIAPGERKLWNSESYKHRLRNTSRFPKECAQIFEADLVQEVEPCLHWCRDSLGPSSCIAYALSYDHYITLATRVNASVRMIYETCAKVEVAAQSRHLVPSELAAYLLALCYVVLCINVLVCSGDFDMAIRRLRCQCSYGCCRASIESCREGFVLVKPFLDAVIVLTFLRHGQPHYAVFMLAGFCLSYLLLIIESEDNKDSLRCQPFGIYGIRALLKKSTTDGTENAAATAKLEKLQAAETFECCVGTVVQLYSIFRILVAQRCTLGMQPKCARLLTVLALCFRVAWSLCSTLPKCARAVYKLAKGGEPRLLVKLSLSVCCFAVALALWFLLAYAEEDATGVRYVASCWKLVDLLSQALLNAWVQSQWSQLLALLLLVPIRAVAFLSMLVGPIILIILASAFIAESCWAKIVDLLPDPRTDRAKSSFMSLSRLGTLCAAESSRNAECRTSSVDAEDVSNSSDEGSLEQLLPCWRHD